MTVSDLPLEHRPPALTQFRLFRVDALVRLHCRLGYRLPPETNISLGCANSPHGVAAASSRRQQGAVLPDARTV